MNLTLRLYICLHRQQSSPQCNPTTLKLSLKTAGKIFDGTITTWNHADIAAENSGISPALPATTISIVIPATTSDTAMLFKKAIDKANGNTAFTFAGGKLSEEDALSRLPSFSPSQCLSAL